jgi:hypothetical protein
MGGAAFKSTKERNPMFNPDDYSYDKAYRTDLYRAVSAALLNVSHINNGVKTIEAVDALLELAINVVGNQSEDAERWVEQRLPFCREPFCSDSI